VRRLVWNRLGTPKSYAVFADGPMDRCRTRGSSWNCLFDSGSRNRRAADVGRVGNCGICLDIRFAFGLHVFCLGHRIAFFHGVCSLLQLAAGRMDGDDCGNRVFGFRDDFGALGSFESCLDDGRRAVRHQFRLARFGALDSANGLCGDDNLRRLALLFWPERTGP